MGNYNQFSDNELSAFFQKEDAHAYDEIYYRYRAILFRNAKVELDGEAYFEVAHLPNKPFVVVTSKQSITVLETHFNVNSYTDEPTTKTSLLEGSVKIINKENTNPQILKPGQQATLQDGNLKISNVDVQRAIAWKNGDFVFNGENLQCLMREIARWYNVELIYNGDIPNNTGFISTISRKKKITEILKAVELNQNVKFKIEGRRVSYAIIP
jgi:transmembrane sensor